MTGHGVLILDDVIEACPNIGSRQSSLQLGQPQSLCYFSPLQIVSRDLCLNPRHKLSIWKKLDGLFWLTLLRYCSICVHISKSVIVSAWMCKTVIGKI